MSPTIHDLARAKAYREAAARGFVDVADPARLEQQITLGGRHAGCPAGPGHDMRACDRAAAVADDAAGTWMGAASEPVDPYRRQPCGHLQMMRAHTTGACQRCAGTVPAEALDMRGGLVGVTVADRDEADRLRDAYIAAGRPVPPFVYRGGGVAAYPPAIGAPADPPLTGEITTRVGDVSLTVAYDVRGFVGAITEADDATVAAFPWLAEARAFRHELEAAGQLGTDEIDAAVRAYAEDLCRKTIGITRDAS